MGVRMPMTSHKGHGLSHHNPSVLCGTQHNVAQPVTQGVVLCFASVSNAAMIGETIPVPVFVIGCDPRSVMIST